MKKADWILSTSPNITPDDIKKVLLQLKKKKTGYVILLIQILRPRHEWTTLYSSSVLKLTHQQINWLSRRIHQRYEKILTYYHWSTTINEIHFRLIPFSFHNGPHSL